MKPVSCNPRNGGHRRVLLLGSPTGSDLLSVAVTQGFLFSHFKIMLFVSVGGAKGVPRWRKQERLRIQMGGRRN